MEGSEDFRTSDGTEENPQVVSIDQNFSGLVGVNNSYYQVYIPESGVYSITIAKLSKKQNLDIDLYDNVDMDYMSRTAYSDVQSDDGEVLKYFFEEAGRYYFIVKGEYESVSYSLLVTPSEAPNDGTESTPHEIDQNIEGKVGYRTEGFGYSYYKFTPEKTGTYNFSVSNSDVDIYIYSDANYEARMGTFGKTVTEYLFSNVSYYLKVRNESSVSVDTLYYDLNITQTDATNEGSVASHISLNLNETHSATFGPSDSTYNESFYTFTTTYAGTYVISRLNATDGAQLNIELYSDENFKNLWGSSENTIRTTATLSRNTTYYLKVINADGVSDISCDLTIVAPTKATLLTADFIDGDSILDPTELNIGVQYKVYLGTSSGDSSFYKFTTNENDPYVLISFTNPSTV